MSDIYNDMQKQIDVSMQKSRTIYTKIFLYTHNDFSNPTKELSGIVLDGATFTIDANSDIRRTCSISFVPKDVNVGYDEGIWLDSYVKIFIGIKNKDGDIVYTNMGIYIINNPEQVYDATQNIITISGLDMMAKITGLRNGNLIFGEGGQQQPATSYFIGKSSSIKSVMTSVMDDCGWGVGLVDIDQPTPTILTPMDMSFNLGSTAYNIISELRDINSGYETYFDTDGVFHFRQIPFSLYQPWIGGNKIYNIGERCTYNGIVYECIVQNNNHNPLSYPTYWVAVTLTLDTIFADDYIWSKVLISYSKNYDFESVKNYIEVFGKTQNDGNTPYGIAYDNDPNSPFYYAGSVGTINIVLSGGEYDNIYPLSDYGVSVSEFNSLAQQRAEYELYQRCRLQDQITLTCVPVYWLDVNKLVTIKLPDKDNIEYYVIKNINTTLGVDGTQTITLMKYYPLYPIS